MPAASSSARDYSSDVYSALYRCYQQATRMGQPQIASLTLPVGRVDPLEVLERLGAAATDAVYLESPTRQEAVAAYGTALSHESSGPQRFQQAREFVQQWSGQLLPAGTTPSAPLPRARFFCSFTFFDRARHQPGARVFLPTWQITRRQQHSELRANFVLTSGVDWQEIGQRIEVQLQRLRSQPGPPEEPPLGEAAMGTVTSGFKQTVTTALGHIARQRIDKVVLAHAADIVATRPFSVFASLRTLRQRYPDCYVFSVASRGSTFLGASPERLLSLQRSRLVTDALAGSTGRGDTIAADRHLALALLQSPKERDEHQFVVDFLSQRLTQLGLRPSYRNTPTLLPLTGIQHLHTPVRAVVPRHLHPLQLVEALHPTPAVAGVPGPAACECIRAWEPFERGLYAAPLGWIDGRGDSEFIVGIRSALVRHNRARLYAGAGIVKGSDPERELAEVQLKLQALGEALR